MHFYLHYNITRHNRADPLPNRIDTSFYIVLPGSVRTIGIKQQPASLDSFCRNETGLLVLYLYIVVRVCVVREK